MIVIVGQPLFTAGPPGARPGVAVGSAAAIARAAVGAGADVQLVGKVGDDPEGDAILLDLGLAGVGHAATLRDAGHRTPVLRVATTDADDAGVDADDEAGATAIEPADPALRPAMDAADLELALRYLPDVRVVVLVEPGDGLVPVAITEAAASAAHLVVVLAGAMGTSRVSDALPADALVLAAPAEADSTGFASLVGRYAAAVDGGTDPRAAFDVTLARLAGTPTTG